MNRWTGLTSAIGIAVAATLGLSPASLAQLSDREATVPGVETRRLRTLTIPEAFDRAYFEHDRDFFTNRSIERQLEWLLFSWTENEIARDGELVYEVYRDVMTQQITNDPYLRTPDLINPYNTSLDTLNRTGGNPPVRGSEFIFD